MPSEWKVWRVRLTSLAVGVALLASAAAAVGREPGGPRPGGGRGPEVERFRGGESWRGHEGEHWWHGDIRHFREEDMGRWRGGHWIHGDRFGRVGWWWVVGDTWYFYPAPVYPYPDPYLPPTVVARAPGYWYYCPGANEYYPYVAECPEGWTPVVPPPTP